MARPERPKPRARRSTTRGLAILAPALAVLAAAGAAPPAACAQDTTSCTGNYNYCIEQTRRVGGSAARCEATYQQCMRTGLIPDPYNRRPVPVERR